MNDHLVRLPIPARTSFLLGSHFEPLSLPMVSRTDGLPHEYDPSGALVHTEDKFYGVGP